MLYLIGGVSKAGKSYVAKELMKEGIPYFSTDFLLWSLGGVNGDGIFDYYDDDTVTSPIMKPYLKKIITFLMNSNANYCFEGTHLTVSLSQELKREYPGLIKSIFLGYSETTKEKKIAEIKEYESSSDNTWYKALSEKEFNDFIQSEIDYSKIIKEDCMKYNETFFEVKDIDKEINIILELLKK